MTMKNKFWSLLLVSFFLIFYSLFLTASWCYAKDLLTVKTEKTYYFITDTSQEKIDIINIIKKFNYKIKYEDITSLGAYVISAPNEFSLFSLQQKLTQIKQSLKITPIKKYKTTEADPKHWQQQPFSGRWNMEHSLEYNKKYGCSGCGIGAEKLRQLAAKSKNEATIAVIDTGCLTTHKEVEKSLLKSLCYDAYNDKFILNDKDKENHGTGVISVIAGEKNNGIGGYGICPNAKIISIAAVNQEGEFDDWTLVKSLEYIESLVKNDKVKNLHVINMSLGSIYTDLQIDVFGYCKPETDPLYAQIKHLYDKYNIVCVCAAGNDANHEDKFLPADYDCCISVASSADNTLEWFSNYNKYTDFVAPDWNIIASSKSDTATTGSVGTSFSAPVITSAIVCLMQINPKIDVDQAINILKQTSTKIYPCIYTNIEESDSQSKAGIVNAEKAAWKILHKKQYWKGMNDCHFYKKIKYGFKVISSKNKTVKIIGVDYYDKPIDVLFLPKKIKLSDGNIYTVVGLNTDCMCFTKKIKNIIIPSTYKKLSKFSFDTVYMIENNDWKYKNIIIRSKYLNKSTLLKSLYDIEYIKRIIIFVSDSQKVNDKYLKKYKSIFKSEYQTTINKIIGWK